MSEQEAIVGAQSGNPVAFEHLYHEHRANVYHQILRMVHDISTAEDLTQDVFVLMLRKIGQFRGESAFGTWLFRVAHTRVLMHFRNSRIRRTTSLEGMEEDNETDFGTNRGLLAASVNPDYDTAIDIRQQLGELPPGMRDFLSLAAYDGYTVEEMATMAGVTEGTVKSQMHKGRVKIKRAFGASVQ